MDLSRAELSELLHAYVDFVLESHAKEAEDPVLPEVTGVDLRSAFAEGLPRSGQDPKELFGELRERLYPGQRKNGHPGFLGYVCASADPIGAVFDGLASFANQNLTAWRSAPGAVAMERQVLRWLGELTGFAGDGGGLLVSGGSLANATALACALDRGGRRLALAREAALARLTVYVSREGHVSMTKACDVLGLPAKNVRTIGVDRERRLDVQELSRTLRADVQSGLTPACVCVSSGTVNTGAIDPLMEVAELCREHAVWMHIDGAYGAPAASVDEFAWMRAAFEQADSLSIDPHKWLFAPLDVGCLLLRDEEDARRVFSFDAEYTAVTQEDQIEGHAFFDLGLELSRRNRALKVWAILKARGADAIGREIARQIGLRKHLDELIAAQSELEALGSGLSVCCFRYHPGGDASSAALEWLNRGILERLIAGGSFFLSPTTLDGHYALRVCIVNFRTQPRHMEFLVDEVLRLGRALDGDA